MFCERCGAQLEEGAYFCTNCGSSTVSIMEEYPGTFPAVIETAEMVNQKKKRGKVALIIAAILMVLLATAVGVFVATGGVEKVKVVQQLNLGNRYLEDMNYEEAIVAFERAIEIEPKAEKAYLGLADAYIGLGDYESAVAALQNGIEETDSDTLQKRLEEVQEEWDDTERRVYGCVYAVDTDLDDTNNVGIPEVDVKITSKKGKTISCKTDSEGRFESKLLSKGTYTIKYSVPGYVEYEEEVKLNGGKYEMNIFIEPDMRSELYGSVLIADEDMNYANNQPLAGAEVSLVKLNGSNAFSTVGTTDGNGRYVIPDLLMGVYSLKVSSPGYLTAEQTLVVYEGQNVSYNALIEAISTQWQGKGTASGTVYDALTGQGVAGLTLMLRNGIGNMSGEVVETFETDASGRYQTPELEGGNYCIEIKDHRQNGEKQYLGAAINVKVLGGRNIDNQDGTVSNTIQTGQVRIVMTWGETPRDLDSHMGCFLESGEQFHIYYGSRTFYAGSEKIADLDLDDTDCYGPETTTIYQPNPGEYTFTVHNYSGGSDIELANSGACVQVYMGYSAVPTYVFYVPNAPGYDWEVFHYSTTTGVLTPSNRMY